VRVEVGYLDSAQARAELVDEFPELAGIVPRICMYRVRFDGIATFILVCALDAHLLLATGIRYRPTRLHPCFQVRFELTGDVQCAHDGL
jgi:hypothetical protein